MKERPDIFEEIYDQILTGDLRPGDRLKEADLVEQFQISRTPVREALRRLETRGLLTHEPHKGMVVTMLEPEAVAELYLMREVLDGTAAAMAAQHASEIEIDALEGQVERDRQWLSEPQKLASANRAFHLAIYRAAHNRFLLRAQASLDEALALLGPTTLAVDGRAKESLGEHKALVKAIRSRDSGSAENLAREHIRSAFRARLKLVDDEDVSTA